MGRVSWRARTLGGLRCGGWSLRSDSRGPARQTLLVDAGGPVGGQQTELGHGENVVSPYLWARGISRLDVVAITHGHSDHIGGMHAVRNNFRPHELWIGALPSTASITAVLNYARSLGIRVMRRSDGEAFDFGGMQADVFPPPPSWTASSQPGNNDSLVLRLRYRDSTALLEGDAEPVVEQCMVATQDLHADLLRVGHHGSNTISTEELVRGASTVGDYLGGYAKQFRASAGGSSAETDYREGDDLAHRPKRCGGFLSRWEFGKPAVG